MIPVSRSTCVKQSLFFPSTFVAALHERIHWAPVGAESADRRTLAMPVFRKRPAPIGMLAFALLPAIVGWPRVATAAGATDCPDVSGRYSVIATGAGTWTALTDALAALHAREAGYIDSGIELSGAADGRLSVRTRSSRSDSWSTHPAVLHAGIDFNCQSGRLLLVAPVKNTSRKTDEGRWYEGESTASLSRASNGELSIAVRFTGSERVSLYKYESADISLPKPGTRTTLTSSFRWPVYSDAVPLEPVQPAVPDIVRETRHRLTPEVLGNVVLAALKPSGEGALASLTMSRSNEVVALEDRLRAARIRYETRVEPAWWNNAYHMELLIRPAGAEANPATQPSAFRIEQELQRTLPALVVIDEILATDDGYVVTLNIFDSIPVSDVIRRVQLNSTLIGSMELIEESAPTASQLRIARLKVGVR